MKPDGTRERGPGSTGSTLHGIGDDDADLVVDWLVGALLAARRLRDEVVIAQVEDALRHAGRRHAPGNPAIERAPRP